PYGKVRLDRRLSREQHYEGPRIVGVCCLLVAGGVLWGVWVVPSAWASVLGGGCSWVEHWLLQNFPCHVLCGCCCVWWWGAHCWAPGQRAACWGGWLLGAARLFGLLLWVAGGGIVGSLRTVQWTRASLIFVVFVVLSC